MYKTLVLICLVLAAASQVTLIAVPDVVLGVPGEWQWSRHAASDPLWMAIPQYAPALFGMVLLYYVARFGSNRLYQHHSRCVGDFRRQRSGPPPGVTAIFLAALIGVSWLWMKTCERSTPTPHRNLKSLWVLYDPSSSGYFFEAAFHMDSTAEFLTTYRQRMQEGDVLHVGTHPPGLFLLSRLALKTLENFPGLTEPLSWMMLRGDVESFRLLESEAAFARALSEEELSALFLLSELTTLAAALTIVPLYYSIRCIFNALIAWRTACLWATFPCLIVFLPKSDVLFTFTSMSAVCLGVHAHSSTSNLWERLLLAAGCGSVLWCGLFMSLAHLPALALLAALCGLRATRILFRKNGARSSISAAISVELLVPVFILATLSLATWGFTRATGCNMAEIWKLNLTNHAGFYEQSVRTFNDWLLINPIELGMSIGLPAAVICVIGVIVAVFGKREGLDGPGSTLAVDYSVAVVLTVCALWLSGKNSGEAARLWCFLTPWLLLLAAHVLRTEQQSDGYGNSATVWKSLLFVQMVVCVLTVGRVNGFQI